jgi:large repetitive protein
VLVLAVVLGLPRSALAQTPLTISATGLTCTNGVCDLGTFNVGTFLNQALSASGGSGTSTGPDQWQVIAGHLPASLKMAKFFGVESTEITGTPTKVETSTFTEQVQDPAGDTAQQALSMTIDPPLPLVVTTPSNCCSAGTVGTAYSAHFFAVGGVQPYTWVLVAGQFPPGLSLDRSGLLSGTPTTTGTFTFTVQVTDKAGTQVTGGPFSITVSQDPAHRRRGARIFAAWLWRAC